MDDKHFNQSKWTMLLVLMFCYFFYYCGRQNFGFAILGIQNTLNLTTADTGLISAGLLLFYGIGQAINGFLADKYSARKLVTLGALLSILFNIIASFATDFWQLLIPWCCIGYAQSLGFAPGSKMITNWWPKKERGKAFGLYLSSSGIASIVVYAVCIEILVYLDWRWLFRLPVLLLFISSIIFYCIARDKPEDLGYASVNDKTAATQPDLSIKSRYYFVMSHFHFQMASIAMGFCSIARYGLLIWLPVIFLEAKNIQSVWTAIVFPVGMTIGTIAAGTISDKLFNADRIKPTILFMLCAAFLTMMLYLIPPGYTALNIILIFLIGFFVYGPQSSLFALCPELLGIDYSGTAVGVMNAYGYGFSAAGEALIGYMIHYSNHTSVAYLVVTIACLCAVLAAILARPNSRHKPEFLAISTG